MIEEPSIDQQSLAPAALPCASCDAPCVGVYCGACGQRRREGRLSVTDVGRHLVADALDIDKGILHTVRELFREPGAVIRDYWKGRTVPFTNPVKYFLITLALVQVVALWTGFTGGFVSGFAQAAQGPTAERTASVLDRFFPLLMAPGVLLLAAFQRSLFKRAGRNYAEHLVMALFLSGQLLLSSLVVFPLTTGNKMVGRIAVLIFLAGALWFHSRAARQTFNLPWRSAVARSALALSLTAISYVLVLSLVLAILVAN